MVWMPLPTKKIPILQHVVHKQRNYTNQLVLVPLDFDFPSTPSSSWLVAVAPPLAPPLPATAGVRQPCIEIDPHTDHTWSGCWSSACDSGHNW